MENVNSFEVENEENIDWADLLVSVLEGKDNAAKAALLRKVYEEGYGKGYDKGYGEGWRSDQSPIFHLPEIDPDSLWLIENLIPS